jgi:hypothetical protein
MTENEQQPLFEVISETQYRQSTTPRGRKVMVTEPRNMTTWIALPTTFGHCTVPKHDEVIDTLSDEQKEYRKKFMDRHNKEPIRMIVRIGELDVCRDCYYVGADKE